MANEKSEIRLCLASGSARRKEMLQTTGLLFDVEVSHILEEPKAGETPVDYVRRNATEKALAVGKGRSQYVLGADTIVVLGEKQILEKPRDFAHACAMLQSLSGQTHTALSGYALCLADRVLVARVVSTEVVFRTLLPEEIVAFVNTGEPFDKSGAYGIQGSAMGFIERIHGSYTNVMGLPLSQVVEDLRNYAGLLTF